MTRRNPRRRNKLSGAVPPLAKGPRAVRLRTAFDVQRALARLYNRLMRDEVHPGIAGKGTYILSVMLKAVELVTLEERIQKLERQAKDESS